MTINKGKTNEELVQKYLARKKAREQEPKVEPEIIPNENGLVYAAGGTIFLFRQRENDVFITDRTEHVADLCSEDVESYDARPYGIRLYDAGDYGIRDTLYHHQIIPENSLKIEKTRALCFHKGNLYAGTENKIYDIDDESAKKVSETLKVNALCSHNGELLYAVDGGGAVFYALKEGILRVLTRPVLDLCSHDNTLYDARIDGIHKTLEEEVVLEREPIGEDITKLCSHNGELLYVEELGLSSSERHWDICELSTDEAILSSDVKISAMYSIPSSLVQRILEEKAV
ncbi:hypothetical protein GOV06_04170 [Candidatus Woesearchaeota archaeon]|nr:hypothetical protein [Candidatus Woesearchaeota archaeon]